MKILSMGWYVNHPSLDETEFSSDTSLFDYDVLIWDPQTVFSEYPVDFNHSTYKGFSNLSESSSHRIVEDITRRLREMVDMLHLGRTIVIFTPYPDKCYVDTGKREYSGTGRNRQTTNLVSELNLMSFLPPDKVNTVKSSGVNIEFKGRDVFSSFWRRNKKYFTYRAYFEEAIGEPLLLVKGTKKVISSYFSVGKGHLIYLPEFLDELFFDEITDEEMEKILAIFIDSIIELVEELNKSGGDFKLPEWSSRYLLPDELEKREQIKKSERKMEDIKSEISTQKSLIAKLEQYKILFAGDGRALELEVANIFKELGFEATEGLVGRDDLILKYDTKVAVVEVKGVSKSAAEKHTAQLEKWVTEYYVEKGIMPKGILVINPYKNIPLRDRNEAPFPPQMIPFSEKREHCLITGLQLLCLYFDIKGHPEKKKKIIELIFETKGAFGEYNNWEEHIAQIDEKVDTKEAS